MTVCNGTAISYDEIGNPLNDGTWTYTWEHGRQLASMSKNETTWNYEYDASGMRIRRTDGTTAYTYVYTGSNLVYMSVGTNAIRIGYDLNGSPIGLQYNGVLYFYVTNLQGDIIAILNTDGEPVVNYTYDAWGNILSTTGSMASTLGAHNPLRYRGYVYDQETGLYYLQSRYYNPEWGRFINADGLAATGQGLTGNNMFAYCGNNPVCRKDPTGDSWFLVFVVVAVVAVVFSGCAKKQSTTTPRADLANAPDLDIKTASPKSYNCYGNGIGKQIAADPTGYSRGDSTRETFNAVVNDLGKENVRELSSIDDPIESDEFKVALKCGRTDYHFIRLDENGWYNKSGSYYEGVYVTKSTVANSVWWPTWKENGVTRTSRAFCYNDETIYFAVKVGWDSK